MKKARGECRESSSERVGNCSRTYINTALRFISTLHHLSIHPFSSLFHSLYLLPFCSSMFRANILRTLSTSYPFSHSHHSPSTSRYILLNSTSSIIHLSTYITLLFFLILYVFFYTIMLSISFNSFWNSSSDIFIES